MLQNGQFNDANLNANQDGQNIAINRTNTLGDNDGNPLNPNRKKSNTQGLQNRPQGKYNENTDDNQASPQSNNRNKINFDKPILGGYIGIIPDKTGNELSRTVRYLKGGVALRVTRSAEINPRSG